MDKQDIIAEFPDYAWASDYARNLTEDADSNFRLSDIGQDIPMFIWGSSLSGPEKIQLLADVYTDIPTYSLWFIFYSDLWRGIKSDPDQTSTRTKFWSLVRQWLSGDSDELAEPICYTLWCDYFEDKDDVVEAWNALVQEGAPDRLLERVLENSGPVPYNLKIELYQRLIHDHPWHYFIFESILHSEFDYYGKIDRRDARAWLERLQLNELSDEDKQSLERLKSRLTRGI